MCILLNVKKHEKTFALNVDIFKDNKKVKKLVDFVLFCDIIFVVRLGKGKTLYVLPSTITQQKGGQEKVCQMSSLKKTSL